MIAKDYYLHYYYNVKHLEMRCVRFRANFVMSAGINLTDTYLLIINFVNCSIPIHNFIQKKTYRFTRLPKVLNEVFGLDLRVGVGPQIIRDCAKINPSPKIRMQMNFTFAMATFRLLYHSEWSIRASRWRWNAFDWDQYRHKLRPGGN